MEIQAISNSSQIAFGKKEKENKSQGNVINGLAGFAAGTVVKAAGKPVQRNLYNRLIKSAETTPQEAVTINSGIDKALKNSGLKEKGYEIIRLSEGDQAASKAARDAFAEGLDKKFGWFIKKLDAKNKEAFYDSAAKPFIEMTEKGKNAYYVMTTKKMLMHKDKLSSAAFHEMGHALNESSKWTKALQNSKLAYFAAGPLLLVALFNKKKTANDDQKLSPWAKVTNFVRNHIVALTGLAFAPMVIEEGMASIRGQKLAKEVLDKNMLKKVTKTHKFSFAGYAATAVIAMVAAKAGVMLKDHLQMKQDIKKAEELAEEKAETREEAKASAETKDD